MKRANNQFWAGSARERAAPRNRAPCGGRRLLYTTTNYSTAVCTQVQAVTPKPGKVGARDPLATWPVGGMEGSQVGPQASGRKSWALSDLAMSLRLSSQQWRQASLQSFKACAVASQGPAPPVAHRCLPKPSGTPG